LVVSGAYYTTDDRIRFELVLTDALHDRILVSFAPVTAAVRDPTPGLDTVRKRVLAAVAQAVNVSFDDPVGSGNPPPSFEAYQLYIAADGEFRRSDVGEGGAHAAEGTRGRAQLSGSARHAGLGSRDKQRLRGGRLAVAPDGTT